MFRFFFCDACRVSQLEQAVERYQKVAMLRYGNFVFAYRMLSRIFDEDQFLSELGSLCIEGDGSVAAYSARAEKLLEVENIPRNDTSLVGYLSATQIVAEAGRSKLLRVAAKSAGVGTSWEGFEDVIRELSKPEEHLAVVGMIRNYQSRYPGRTPEEFSTYVAEIAPEVEGRHARLQEVQGIASRNQDVYLTWDHMDVYFATSMRKTWEFSDLYDFISGLMNRPEIQELKVRYFDPTQSYTGNRVDKGLVESLMLKRAKCTVYSVQDTDTLGKDSELAATLAQGKPVIAYVPAKSESDRTAELLQENPQTVLERLRFVLNADDRFMANLSAEERTFVAEFRALPDFAHTTVFRSVQERHAVEHFHRQHGSEMERLCRLIAVSENRIYDSRANTLKRFHPLGIQVNLATGVANGVMVVRSVAECAALLRSILTDTMEFDVVEDSSMWYLRERISGSYFRVVTKNAKISNCFWNFYLRG
ncbi:MAG: hypothetical protein HY820_09340 [Acidobacteria bacterium]|nr:hypothetical protein [Acidobacteriota bacterium]